MVMTPGPAVTSYPYRGGNKTPVIVAVVTAAVMVVGIGIAAVRVYHGDRSRPTAQVPAAGPAGAVNPVNPVTPPVAATTGPSADTTPSPSPSPSVDSSVDSEATAVQTLTALRLQDQPTFQFTSQYAAQLASKVVGISDPYQTAANGTHTFYAADILAEHLALRQGDNLGARVVLVLSTDYGKRQLYQGQPLWVTFALGAFDSAGAVSAWCARRFPQLSGDLLTNQCTARKLEPPHA
jgi:hypothetical protein